MDLGTFIGLMLALIALLGAFAIEALELVPPIPIPIIGLLISPTAGMIVFGGTFAALLISFPLPVVINARAAMMKAFFFKGEGDPGAIVDTFVRLSEKARREGLLSLEEEEAA